MSVIEPFTLYRRYNQRELYARVSAIFVLSSLIHIFLALRAPKIINAKIRDLIFTMFISIFPQSIVIEKFKMIFSPANRDLAAKSISAFEPTIEFGRMKKGRITYFSARNYFDF